MFARTHPARGQSPDRDDGALGIVLSARHHRHRQGGVPAPGRGQPDHKDGKLIGSTLIGQSFSDPKYFWGRPSATSAAALQRPRLRLARILGPLNPALLDQVKANAKALHDADPGNTAAGSGRSRHGLGERPRPGDQPRRRALPGGPGGPRARSSRSAQVEALISAHEQGRLLGFIGEPRVNVLELNLALDQMR